MAEVAKFLNPPTLDLTVGRYNNFKQWMTKWRDYEVLTNLKEKPDEYQSAMLRYTFSSETRHIYDSFNLNEDDSKNSETIIQRLETFAKGIINETMERHSFNNRKQEDGEKFDDFLTDIKVLSKNCNFCNQCYPSMLRDRIVGGIKDDHTRQKLLADPKLTPQKAEEMCRAVEKAEEGMTHLRKDKQGESIQYVSQQNQQPNTNYHSKMHQSNRQSTHNNKNNIRTLQCKFCTRTHPFGRDSCPAWGQTCAVCKQKNHFAASQVCRMRKNIREVREETHYEENDPNHLLVNSIFLGSVKDVEKNAKDWKINVLTKKGNITLKIDTGADVSLIGPQHLKQMGLTQKEIQNTNKMLFGPANNRLDCLGYVTTMITFKSKTTKQLFYVCPQVTQGLLGKPAINALEILQINSTEITQDFIKQYPQVFTGLGKIEGQPVNINLKENTTPHHISAPRHVALPLLQPLKEELDRMLNLGVIKKVDEPTEWCHPIVIVPKDNGAIRLCIDLTKLNEGVQREFYQLESVDETLAKLGKDCNVMSKLDANSGYWQIPLDEESQLKATFITPFGRFCPTRGPFGLASMQEIFNKRLDKIISGLKGVAKSTDDFLVHGKTVEEHDQRMHALLTRLAENKATLNVAKCKFHQTEVDFLGHRISEQGIQPLTDKLNAITNYKAPQNITELRRFMGMAQQLSKFTPTLAEASAPLRDLLSSKSMWLWTTVHQVAFEKTKQILTTQLVLAHYDIQKETKIRTDGSSKNGISAILYQKHGEEWKPVAYASRFLSTAESNYHPIEVEMLAVVWGCEKMSKYIHGLPEVIIETDHKPLIPIINNKPLHDMSPRIQRLRMRLMKYQVHATHVRGKDLTDADALSRSPNEKPSTADQLAEEEIRAHVNLITNNIPASADRLEEIRDYTQQDITLQTVIEYIHKGWPTQKSNCHQMAQPYWNDHQNLTFINGLLMKGEKIVIPTALRKEMLKRIHEGHMGMSKCKRRARQCLFWPNIANDIEQMVRKCEECAKLLPSKPNEPLMTHQVPSTPWTKVGSDLFDYAGKQYIVIVDYYTLWPEVYQLKKNRLRSSDRSDEKLLLKTWYTNRNRHRQWKPIQVTKIPNICKGVEGPPHFQQPQVPEVKWYGRKYSKNGEKVIEEM